MDLAEKYLKRINDLIEKSKIEHVIDNNFKSVADDLGKIPPVIESINKIGNEFITELNKIENDDKLQEFLHKKF